MDTRMTRIQRMRADFFVNRFQIRANPPYPRHQRTHMEPPSWLSCNPVKNVLGNFSAIAQWNCNSAEPYLFELGIIATS